MTCDRPLPTLYESMTPCNRIIVVGPDTPLEEATGIMRDRRFDQLPVLRNDRLVGIITMRNLSPRDIDISASDITVGSYMRDPYAFQGMVRTSDQPIDRELIDYFDTYDFVLIALHTKQLVGIAHLWDIADAMLCERESRD
ncbi:MAG: CBS domain-containing protein [bacterium]|nr:CBS domain-containing protein [bacterium]